MSQRFIPAHGVQANAWANAPTGAGQNSGSLNTYNLPFVSAFGHANAATTITLMLSMDGTNWYAGPTVVLSGAGDFFINATVGAQWVCLQSTNNVTVTATLAAKG